MSKVGCAKIPVADTYRRIDAHLMDAVRGALEEPFIP